MSIPTIGTRPAEEPDKVTGPQAARVFGAFLLGVALLPPITVILWRIATMPWGG